MPPPARDLRPLRRTSRTSMLLGGVPGRAARAVVALVATTCLTACAVTNAEDDATVSPAARPADLIRPSEAISALDALPAVPRSPAGLPIYDRAAFGDSWADVDGNGCNQRDDVLLRDAVPGSVSLARQGACHHDVLAGTWVDPYTGRILELDDLKDLSQAQALQIDHVVPLAEAWRSGAHAWPPTRRRAFANDLDGLLAVDGPTNSSKSDDDPAAWRPRQSHQCAYATRWIQVKHTWSLGVDDSERRALTEMMAACQD